MAKVNFRVKNMDSQQYLIYDLTDDLVLDEEVLDAAEEGQIKSMISMGYLEGEDGCSLCYDITDRNTLNEYFEYDIDKKTILTILKNIIYTLVELRERAIPLNYVILHKGYIYIDIDTLDLDFICIPIESNEKISVDVAGFVRGIISGLKYNKDENGDYIVKILTFINDKELFSVRGLLAMIEANLIDMDGNVDNALSEEYDEDEIIADYEELESYEEIEEEPVVIDRETMLKEARAHMSKEDNISDSIENVEEDSLDDANESEEDIEEELIDVLGEIADQLEEIKKEIPEISEEYVEVKARPSVENIEDLDAEYDRVVIRKGTGLKINRAQVIQNSTSDEDIELEEESESIELTGNLEDEEIVSNSILSQAISNAAVKATPKPMPYVIRVNTEERIMINKQTFKIGKASIGMDYRITGNSAISRAHATIYSKEGVYFIKDNKSTNHTYVNGIIVDEAMDQMLTHEAEIILGDEEFIFKLR